MATPVSTIFSQTALIPRERMSESERWRFALNNALQKTSVGFLVTGAVAMVVCRTVPARIGVASFGAGIGAGRAFVDARYIMGHDVVADKEWVATVKART